MPKLTPDALAQLPHWKARKQAQWERISDELPGLQLLRYGERQSTYMLVHSTPDHYEGIVFGRLPKQRVVPARGPRPAQTVITETLIDLTDDQLRAVLYRWLAKRSALDLDFIEAVFDRNGQRKTR